MYHLPRKIPFGGSKSTYWFHNFFSFPLNRLLSYVFCCLSFLPLLILLASTHTFSILQEFLVRGGLVFFAISFTGKA